jgi:predicted permease
MPSLPNVAINIIGPIFLVIGVAVVFGRRFSPDLRTLSTLLIYVFSPCLVFEGIYRANLQTGQVEKVVAMVALITAALGLTGWVLARLFHFDRQLETSFIVTLILVNAANYGIPLNEFAFGPEGRQGAVIYYTVTAVIANNLGIYLVSRGKGSARQALLNVVRAPLIYGALLALILNLGKVELPLPIERAVTILSQASIPGMLILLGLQLARVSIAGRLWPIVLAAGTRLVVAPVFAFVLAAWLGLTGVARQVSIVEASMPTAVLAIAITAQFGGDSDFTSAVILFSTLASIVTLTVLLSILIA